MRSIKRAVSLVALASVVGTVTAEAQEGIGIGYSDVGAVLGLGGIGRAGVALGARYENIVKHLPDLGNGLLGVQVSADWWSWNDSYSSGNSTSSFGQTVIPIGVTANYHFKLEDSKFDPFVGAGLAYWLVSSSGESCTIILGVEYCYGSGYSSGSGIHVVTKAGIRYFYSPATTFYADLGIGAAAINVGVTLRLKAGSAPPRRGPGVVGAP